MSLIKINRAISYYNGMLIANWQCFNDNDGPDYDVLGTYPKERALEILDEIQERLKPNFETTFTKEGLYVAPSNYIVSVYEMPEN
jgi:hypothetical protein